jgi:arsenite methyltransferase
MKSEQETRDQVSKNYADALKRTQDSAAESNCEEQEPVRKSCCGGGAAPEATVAQLAGYGEIDMDLESAAASSFGCGNPLAFQHVAEGQTVLDLGSGAGLDLLIAA